MAEFSAANTGSFSFLGSRKSSESIFRHLTCYQARPILGRYKSYFTFLLKISRLYTSQLRRWDNILYGYVHKESRKLRPSFANYPIYGYTQGKLTRHFADSTNSPYMSMYSWKFKIVIGSVLNLTYLYTHFQPFPMAAMSIFDHPQLPTFILAVLSLFFLSANQ